MLGVGPAVRTKSVHAFGQNQPNHLSKQLFLQKPIKPPGSYLLVVK
jgi:hypothetical protein